MNWPRNQNGQSDAYDGEGMHSTGDTELTAVGRVVRTAYLHEAPPDVAEAHIVAILAAAERVAAAGADRVRARQGA